MDVFEAINKRKSFRKYSGDVTEEEIEKILLAGEYSPVGRAMYDTLQITVVKNKELMEKINAWSADFFKSNNHEPLYGAPVYFVVSTKLKEGDNNVPYSNAATVVENMALEAVNLNLGTCHIWGATAALAKNATLVKELDIPEDFTPVCGLVVGMIDEEYVERNLPKDRIKVNYVK